MKSQYLAILAVCVLILVAVFLWTSVGGPSYPVNLTVKALEGGTEEDQFVMLKGPKQPIYPSASHLQPMAGPEPRSLTAAMAAPLLTSEPIASEQFRKLHALIKPQEGESKYLDEIPWMGTLWEARQKAAAEGKPIFVMATGYHSLGFC